MSEDVQAQIRQVCADLADFLCKKNEAYGNSALNPCRIFAKDVDADAQLNVRIDDKLNRLMRGNAYAGDNDVLDLAGYLVLKLVKAGWGGGAMTITSARVASVESTGWAFQSTNQRGAT